MKPVIGIFTERRDKGDFNANFPYLAMEAYYFDAVSSCGGLPIALPDHPDLAADYINTIDGLLAPGGFFPMPLSVYAASSQPPAEQAQPRRYLSDMAFINAALAANKPVLGICGGMQELNVHFGGSLYYRVAQGQPSAIDHCSIKADQTAHRVDITPETLLHRICKLESFAANSRHKECVAQLGSGLIVSAVGEDGVIEALEHPAYRFCLGVQWHPEYFCDKDTPHKRIMESFINACRT